jgi:hypothetical protein
MEKHALKKLLHGEEFFEPKYGIMRANVGGWRCGSVIEHLPQTPIPPKKKGEGTGKNLDL